MLSAEKILTIYTQIILVYLTEIALGLLQKDLNIFLLRHF